jgi:dihydroorotate dehydrogenase (NAD+) catalytic subunit
VLELIACGATGVALGTVLFTDPGAPARIRRELAVASASAGLDNAEQAFCAAQEAVFEVGNNSF